MKKIMSGKFADAILEGTVPAYLLDREGVDHTKILSNIVKQKRKEKVGNELSF